jgi:hypothetical protein
MNGRAFLLFLLLFACERLRSQISPGELSAAHQQLEGVNNCTACHEQGKVITGAKCLACHETIREALDAKHGFHFLRGAESCTSCHKEHVGRNGRITQFGRATFVHTTTGFSLNGKHAKLQCEQCHKSENIKSGSVQKSLRQRPRATYLGLSQQCSACHADKHTATLGTRCESCHEETGWKPAVLFMHSKTKFPLTGKHSELLCEKCHQTYRERNARQSLLFSLSGFSECKSCHQSPHGRTVSQQPCQACHVPEGWKVVQNFKHEGIGFALQGRHARVACDKCHISMRVQGTPEASRFKTESFSDCTPCHASPHAASFARAKCASCHTPEGWKTAKGKSFDHALTAFPLNGKHATLVCSKCHRQAGKDVFKPTQLCGGCHEDVHRGEFAKTHQNHCERCHSAETFRPATYGMSEHSAAKFKLTGAHRATACRACHWKENKLLFRFDSVACAACHEDKHRGQFVARMNERSCATCHSTKGWNIDSFDHGVTGYELSGKHAALRCDGCHRRTDASLTVRYAGTARNCASCHTDPHVGQFSVNGETNCSRCHTPVGWRSLLFQHSTQSAFPLTGAHKNVECIRCHKTEEGQGKQFVRYKPLPTQCESCHQQGVGK